MNKIRIVMLALQFFCSNSTAISPSPLTINPLERTSQSLTLDVLTVYNPVAGQCDATPLVTASNQRINPTQLRSGTIRWMALSRDLLKRWGGKIHYGDTINLSAGDPTIDGLWVVHDTMNRRFRKRGDLLFDARVRSTGKWSNVVITLQNRRTSASGDEVPTGLL
ncbi:MAG TPA: hypothetical protein VK589_14965 [Chryseolinea sp.]|nr:hypothetical protein [Chryseolinea sp.]